MTTLDTLRDAIPEYARDLKLNLGSVLATSGAPGLTDKQIRSPATSSRSLPLTSIRPTSTVRAPLRRSWA
jgi:hypothetical protein